MIELLVRNKRIKNTTSICKNNTIQISKCFYPGHVHKIIHIINTSLKKVFEQQGLKMLKNLEQSLHNQIHASNTVLSPIAKRYASDILNILKDKEISSPRAVFENIQRHLLINQPPKDFRMPLIIPIKKASLEELKVKFSEDEINKVALDSGTLTDIKTRKAIASIMTEWNPFLRAKVQKAIHSSLSPILPDSSEIL